MGATMQPAKTAEVTPCALCPLRRRSSFRELSAKEVAFLERFKKGEAVVAPGATILLEGTASPHLYTILDGWAMRHKTLEDGRRQVLNFALPGDLVGLQSAVMGEMQHTVTALTRTVVCRFRRDRVWSVFRDHPALGFAITWLAAREEQLLDGHLLSIGQRTAPERAAYLALHLYDRASAVGQASDGALRAPFSRGDFADALGITPVHLSRTLRRLHQDGLLRWTDDTIVIADRGRLERLAKYEGIDLGPRPLV